MKKLLVFALTAALLLSVSGCRPADGEGVKLNRVEVTDLSGDREPVRSAPLSQEEVGVFLAEDEPWPDADDVDEAALTPVYTVAVWQDATQTALGGDAPEPLKILEFVLYEGTDVVKCKIMEESLPEQVSGLLQRFQTAPQGFFDAVNALLDSGE